MSISAIGQARTGRPQRRQLPQRHSIEERDYRGWPGRARSTPRPRRLIRPEDRAQTATADARRRRDGAVSGRQRVLAEPLGDHSVGVFDIAVQLQQLPSETFDQPGRSGLTGQRHRLGFSGGQSFLGDRGNAGAVGTLLTQVRSQTVGAGSADLGWGAGPPGSTPTVWNSPAPVPGQGKMLVSRSRSRLMSRTQSSLRALRSAVSRESSMTSSSGAVISDRSLIVDHGGCR